jgi:hypothetical protein
MYSILVVAMMMIASSHAFMPALSSVRSLNRIRLYDSVDTMQETPEPMEEDERMTDSPKTGEGLFNMNRRVRLGRSRDQDGKSNIWSIEPKMVVEEDGESQGPNNLVIGGTVVGLALACLPLFSLFSQLFPDPSDF